MLMINTMRRDATRRDAERRGKSSRERDRRYHVDEHRERRDAAMT
jgi:hypothetical protein